MSDRGGFGGGSGMGRGGGSGMGRGGQGMGRGRRCGRGHGAVAISQPGLAPAATAASSGRRKRQPELATGSDRHLVARVEQGKCILCGICIDACPEGAISMDGVLVIDPVRCTGCGTCIPECPPAALSLGRPAPLPTRAATE